MEGSAVLRPGDVLITPRLYERAPRPPQLKRELSAYRELSDLMTADAALAIQRFLDLAVELCPAAGSAGLSELAIDAAGETYFEWTAMSGALAPYVGGTTPRDFSPCGLCLDNHHTILVERPGRVFTYFNEAEPEIVEGLIVPLYDTGKRPLGTLWVTSHEGSKLFDPTDARVMEQLAVQLVLAIKLRRKAKILVQLEETAKDNETLVYEVRHRVKNMIQMTSSLLHLQERAVKSSDARSALREARNRLLVLSSVYESFFRTDVDARKVEVCRLIEVLTKALGDSSPNARRITIRADCDSVQLGVTTAVPLGLIVNEAVTNALKHAFEPDGAGEINVQLRRTGSSCSLTISDNGKGFDRPVRDGSLGMRLIKSLARQLKAKLAIDGSNGATIRLDFTVGDTHEFETEIGLTEPASPAASVRHMRTGAERP